MARRLRTLALTLVAGMLGAALAIAVGPAQAETATTGNPWQHTMTQPGNGLVVTGGGDAQNDSALGRCQGTPPTWATLLHP